MAVAVADVVEALADLPSGPALGAALAAVDPTRVLNNFLPELLAAQSRQSAHEAARMLGVLAEVGRARPTVDDTAVDRLEHPYLHSADEVRAALAWSRRAADAENRFRRAGRVRAARGARGVPARGRSTGPRCGCSPDTAPGLRPRRSSCAPGGCPSLVA
jgi:hypothetical protein